MTSENDPPKELAREILFTVKQVAAHLGLSISSVYELVSQGKLRALRLGPRRGAIRIRVDDLQIYLRFASADANVETRSPNAQPTRGRQFKHLDAERLRAAWRKQGATAGRRDGRNTQSSELSYGPSMSTKSSDRTG